MQGSCSSSGFLSREQGWRYSRSPNAAQCAGHDRASPRRRADQDRRAPLRRLEISFSQGAEWKALISRYVRTIPLSGDASCAAEQSMSEPPPKTPVSSAMTAKVGAAARHSQSAARKAAALPLPAWALAILRWATIITSRLVSGAFIGAETFMLLPVVERCRTEIEPSFVPFSTCWLEVVR
jgi:hypothetical protein